METAADLRHLHLGAVQTVTTLTPEFVTALLSCCTDFKPKVRSLVFLIIREVVLITNLPQEKVGIVALARAMLKLQSSPILIVDQSTSSLGARECRQCTWLSLTPLTGLKDHGTDALVQATLREIMADATVLCAVRTHLLYALDA